jgi:peptidoglycan/xylan/chitin deacetylase (PgdA/CDA1 family)
MERETILRIIKPAARLLPQEFLLRLSHKSLLLPFWHAVNDNPPVHYNQLFHVPDSSQFIKTLDWLLKIYKPVNLQDISRLNPDGTLGGKPCMHLSFDDGLRECAEVIAPILIQKGIPATFFVNPSFIGNGGMFYRYKTSILLNKLNRKNLPECVLLGISELLLRNELASSSPREGILSIGYHQRDLLDSVAQLLNLDFLKYLEEKKPYMSQIQLRELIRKGFTVGSHSMDHPRYSDISVDEQLEQTLISTERLCMEYGLDYMAFAFPFSDYLMPMAFWEDLFKKTGHPFPSFGTSGLKADPVKSNLQRLGMEIKGLDGQEIVKSEYLYYLLKWPFGKNKLPRK